MKDVFAVQTVIATFEIVSFTPIQMVTDVDDDVLGYSYH